MPKGTCFSQICCKFDLSFENCRQQLADLAITRHFFMAFHIRDFGPDLRCLWLPLKLQILTSHLSFEGPEMLFGTAVPFSYSVILNINLLNE